MDEYYRTIFTISSEKRRGLELLDDVGLCIRQWAVGEFGEPYAGEERGEWEDENGRLRVYSRKLNASGLSGLVWERQDAVDLDARWRLSLRFATAGNDVEADIEAQGIESNGETTLHEHLGSPLLVLKNLVERFGCSLDGKELEITAVNVPLQDVATFVEDDLFNVDRQMPLVVVSGSNSDDHAKDADELQMQVLGLARVFTYSHDTAWNIAKDLPSSLRCYDGAVRLYSPGCSVGDVSQQHPYWMRDDVDKLAGRFWLMLRRECVNRVPRHGWIRLFAQVREALRKEDIRELENKVEMAEQNQTETEWELVDEVLNMLESESDEFLDDAGSVRITRYDAAIRFARAQMNKAVRIEEDNKQLKDRLALAERRLLSSAGSDELEGDSNVDTSVTDGFVSVLEVVKYAAENLKELRFLSSAFDTAKSEYTRGYDKHASKIYDTLVVLDDCAKKRSRGLGTSIEKWFSNRSVDFSDESISTKRRYSGERTFRDDKNERDVEMMRHIKLLNNDIRIHVRWEKDEGKWLIGYIGEHLPTSSDPH